MMDIDNTGTTDELFSSLKDSVERTAFIEDELCCYYVAFLRRYPTHEFNTNFHKEIKTRVNVTNAQYGEMFVGSGLEEDVLFFYEVDGEYFEGLEWCCGDTALKYHKDYYKMRKEEQDEFIKRNY